MIYHYVRYFSSLLSFGIKVLCTFILSMLTSDSISNFSLSSAERCLNSFSTTSTPRFCFTYKKILVCESALLLQKKRAMQRNPPPYKAKISRRKKKKSYINQSPHSITINVQVECFRINTKYRKRTSERRTTTSGLLIIKWCVFSPRASKKHESLMHYINTTGLQMTNIVATYLQHCIREAYR